MSKKKAKNEIVVRVTVDATPAELRLAAVRLRALTDRLLELAEQADKAIG